MIRASIDSDYSLEKIHTFNLKSSICSANSLQKEDSLSSPIDDNFSLNVMEGMEIPSTTTGGE
jgi:hypothetical protein